jgi:hypothetical protein
MLSAQNHALSLSVLRRGVQARHVQLDTAREEEDPGCGVIELTAIVALDGLDGEAELSGNLSKKVVERGECLRLGT